MFFLLESGHVIEREVFVSMKGMKMVAQRSVEEMDTDFQLSDIMFFTKSGLEVQNLHVFATSSKSIDHVEYIAV